MNDKKFKVVDEKFKCDICGKDVFPLGYTSRDHCPYCLSSKHVDINPGDRREKCRGTLIPIAIENYKKGYKIIYRCEKCKKIRKNVMAKDDNMDLIIEIMSKANIY
jgi:hypothetical protein